MKACLNNLERIEMFCSREKSTELILVHSFNLRGIYESIMSIAKSNWKCVIYLYHRRVSLPNVKTHFTSPTIPHELIKSVLHIGNLQHFYHPLLKRLCISEFDMQIHKDRSHWCYGILRSFRLTITSGPLGSMCPPTGSPAA